MKTLMILGLFCGLSVAIVGCGSESGTLKAPEGTAAPAPEKVEVVPGKKVENRPANKVAD